LLIISLYYLYFTFFIIKLKENIYNFFYFFSKSFNVTFYNYFFIFLFFYFFFINCKKIYFIFINFFIFKYTSEKILTGLLMGYNSIHPYFFYYSIMLSLLFFFLFNSINLNKKFIYYSTWVALALGGYWGFGNTIWGFFWVNDIIEWVLLSLLILFIITIHNYQTNFLKILLISTYMFIVFQLILFRFGFFFTRHSFFDLKNLKFVFVSYFIKIYTNIVWFWLSLVFLSIIFIYNFLVTLFIIKGWNKLFFNTKYNFLIHILFLCLFIVLIFLKPIFLKLIFFIMVFYQIFY
jgi:hypothetical protein